jgi:hypothetical protein
MVLTVLLDDVIQQWAVLCSWAHILADCSHMTPTSYLSTCLLNTSPIKGQSYLTTDSQLTSLSWWCQATIRACDQFFFLLEIFLRQLRACYLMASSLTKGLVCNLLLLLGLASAVPLGSESRWTEHHNLLSQFFTLSQPGGLGSCIYIHQGQDGPVITPGCWSPFRCLLRLAGLRWRYSNLPPQANFRNASWSSLWATRKAPLPAVTPLLHVTWPLPRKGCFLSLRLKAKQTRASYFLRMHF